MKRLNEKEIINLFVLNLRKSNRAKTNVYIHAPYCKATRIGKDDVSIISSNKRLKRGVKLVFKCDMLVENTDVPSVMKPWQIARKSIVACVSDFSAKGIKPFYMSLISVGIPTRYSKDDILGLVKGFKMSSREFGATFVGGDTNQSNELVIDCSMIGFSDNGKIPSRNGAAPGDFIVVSGEFGYSAAGLKIVNEGAKATGNFKDRAISSVVKPEPQQKFGISLAKYFSSSIDSSDGLAVSLYELAAQSKVNFLITKIPSAKGIDRFTRDNNSLDSHELIFHGGEEYHIVATVPSQNMKRLESVAEKLGLKTLVIGSVTKGNGKVFLAGSENTKKRLSLLDNRGYLHLVNKKRK
jgi:thiamine-monophosphate kinase